jgi:hypothetical protein
MRATERAANASRALRWVPPEAREETLAMLEAMTPEERQAMRSRMRALPAWAREALRQKLVAMTPEERRAFLLGPTPTPESAPRQPR